MRSVSMSNGAPLDQVLVHVHEWHAQHADRELLLYAIVDAAQDRATWQRLQRHSPDAQPLLHPPGRASNAFSPHLMPISHAATVSADVARILTSRHPTAAFTLLSSTCSPASLRAHFSRLSDVHLPGGIDMLLAWWDPAILGTLVGQADDDTLHIAGPVLDTGQLATFLRPVVGWWYCDRGGQWHRIHTPREQADMPEALPFSLTQKQEDLLVQASVPDQVLYHLELNQPGLFDADKTHAMRYAFIRSVLGSAHQLGLAGMRDLVNFVALCLIYRRRMQTDPAIIQLLDQVQRKTLTLDQALPLMPQ